MKKRIKTGVITAGFLLCGAVNAGYMSCIEQRPQQECAQEEYESQDARLNDVYQKLMSMNGGDQSLKSTQREWIKKRDECDSPIVESPTLCKAQMTRQRADELQVMVDTYAEKTKEDTLNEDLQAGRKKPENFQEWAIAYNAVNGTSLAKSPKVRADGEVYSLSGKIEQAASDKPEFVAQVISTLNLLGVNDGIAYFYVRIPEHLQEHYYAKARVGMTFNVIGKYVGNMDYQTILGSAQTMPVFDAIYWE